MPNKSCAAILAAVIAMSAASANAACQGGDLKGTWSMYGSTFFPTTTLMMRCGVHLANPPANPFKYSISGSCRLYSPSAPSAVFVVSGNRTLTETTACKLTGSFVLSNTDLPSTVAITVVDGRIESGGAKKTHVEALGHSGSGSENAFYRLSFVR
jgi:hypothetical protein